MEIARQMKTNTKAQMREEKKNQELNPKGEIRKASICISCTSIVHTIFKIYYTNIYAIYREFVYCFTR